MAVVKQQVSVMIPVELRIALEGKAIEMGVKPDTKGNVGVSAPLLQAAADYVGYTLSIEEKTGTVPVDETAKKEAEKARQKALRAEANDLAATLRAKARQDAQAALATHPNA